MALNPNISLQAGANVPQFDPMGAAQKGLTLVDLMQTVQMRPEIQRQQLATARAGELQSIEETTGKRLANEKLRREEAARVILAQLTADHSRAGRDGRIHVDRLTAARVAAQKGLDPDILFNYMQSNEKTEQEGLKTVRDRNEQIQKRADAVNEMIAAQKDPVRAMDIFRQGYEGAARVYGDEAAKEYFTTYFDTKSLGDESVPPALRGAKLMENSRLNKQGKMTSLEQADLALRQEAQSPQYRERISTIPDAGTRAGELARAAETEVFINTNNEGIRAAQSLNKLDTRPGAIVSSAWNRIISQDPAARQLQASIDAYNARNKSNLSIEDGIGAVVQTLGQESRVLGARTGTSRAVATAGNIREAAGTAPEAPRTAPPRAEAAPGRAPQRAIDMLKANPTPEMKNFFRNKYGYLPQGF